MVNKILSEVREYKWHSIVTPVFMILEVAMEMIVPYLMASIIDEGVYAGNMNHILKVGLYMVIAAVVGFIGGLLGG
ncbi:MAG: ABC transporter ATP-binding protein, partial [Lachnospiraceae bacterium]|nr:ABC transporter ATP-binding protein [Lachnospiraceae bacterium]